MKKRKQNANKTQNNFEVYFSEKQQVFFTRKKDQTFPKNHFKLLVNTTGKKFTEFLKSLESSCIPKPPFFSYNDLKDRFNCLQEYQKQVA